MNTEQGLRPECYPIPFTPIYSCSRALRFFVLPANPPVVEEWRKTRQKNTAQVAQNIITICWPIYLTSGRTDRSEVQKRSKLSRRADLRGPNETGRGRARGSPAELQSFACIPCVSPFVCPLRLPSLSWSLVYLGTSGTSTGTMVPCTIVVRPCRTRPPHDIMPASIGECTANLDSLRVGEAVPVVPRDQLPQAARHPFLKASVLVAVLPKDLWHQVPLPCTPGIVHFANASFIFVSLHKVNIGAKDYGSTYGDGFGVDEKSNPAPCLLWSGQDSFDASAPVHRPLWQLARSTHLFVRHGQQAPFVYWGRLLDATLLKDGTPLRARFTIESFNQLASLGFPGRQPVPADLSPLSASAATAAETPEPAASRVSRKRRADSVGADSVGADSVGGPPPAMRSSSRRSKAACIERLDRVKGKWVTEKGHPGRVCAGWHSASVTAVHKDHSGVVLSFDLAYDDGDDGFGAPPHLVMPMPTELGGTPRNIGEAEALPRTAAIASQSLDAAGPSSAGSFDDGNASAAHRSSCIKSEVPEASEPAPTPNGRMLFAVESPSRRGSTRLREAAASGRDECAICMDTRRSHCFVPCGHRCACEECAAKVSVCPICRQPFSCAIRVWL